MRTENQKKSIRLVMDYGFKAQSLFIILFLFSFISHADTFYLVNGVVLEGNLLNPDEIPRHSWYILTQDGVVLELQEFNVVQKVTSSSKIVEQYNASVPFQEENVENQLKLANICTTNNLGHLARQHYRRVLELDVENEEARKALGYQKIGGDWVSQDEEMRRQGYVRDQRGFWVTPQRLLIEQNKDWKSRANDSNVAQAIPQLVEQLRGDQAVDAEKELFAIETPDAVGPLVKALKLEKDATVRETLLYVLNNIGGAEALQEIAAWSMQERDAKVRFTAYSILRKTPGTARFYYSYLKHHDNVVVNNAAFALENIGDPGAIPYLIDALITEHKITILPEGRNTMNLGGLTPRREQISEQRKNIDVLEALRHLSGVDFDFDVVAWRAWWGNLQNSDYFDSRRGSID